MERYLDICAQIEAAVAAIYRGLAGSVECSKEQKEIWLRLAKEEEGHARQLRQAATSMQNEQLPVRSGDRHRAERLLIRAHMILMGMSGLPPEEDEALNLGIRLVEEFRDIHAMAAQAAKPAPLRAIFAGLVQDDERHLGTLQACLAANP